MRLAVLSDTHLSSPSPRLTEENEARLRHMDAVLHCGDHTEESVWAYLSAHPAFYAVRGNMDPAFGEGLTPGRRSFELAGFSIAAVHGDGLGPGDTAENLLELFRDEADLICFGHTHRRQLLREKDIVVLNPGSFSLPKGGSAAGYAIVDLDPELGIRVEWRDL